MKKNIIRFSFILSLFVVLYACGKDDDATPEPAPSITGFSPSSGFAGTIVTITGENLGSTTTSNVVKFGDIIATISSASTTKLVVTVPEGATTAKISVTANGKTADSPTDFTIDGPVTKLELNIDELELYTNDTETLSIAVLETEDVENIGAIIWSSDNPDIIKVSDQGNVTALNAGVAVISATVDNAIATCTITVNPNIYVAGMIGLKKAALWINGVPTELSDGAEEAKTYSVFVNDTDVYVAGYVQNQDKVDVATLWKNGVPTELSNGTEEARVYSVYVSGTNVYVAGSVEKEGSKNIATLWINGVPTELSNGTTSAYANAVYVSDTDDVYVAGRVKNEEGYYPATLWKNGVLTELSDGSEDTYISSLYVNGTDVYVAGYVKNQEGDRVATLWENGVETALFNESNEWAWATSVYVSDTGDVYVAGYAQNEEGITVATLWENGVPTDLTDGSRYARARSVYVSGSDVYVAGYEVAENDFHVAMLWKNGVPTNLTDGFSYDQASSVFVK